jgi:hypothetical protein
MIARQTYRLGSRLGSHTSTRQRIFRFTASTGALFLCAISSLANEARHLTLTEAVHLALQQNRILKIARFKVQENAYRKEAARSDYLPTITNQSNMLHITELQDLSIPTGALGVVAGVPIPNSDTRPGEEDFFDSTAHPALTQPLHPPRKVAKPRGAHFLRGDGRTPKMKSLCKFIPHYAFLWQLRKAAEQQNSFATENRVTSRMTFVQAVFVAVPSSQSGTFRTSNPSPPNRDRRLHHQNE